MVWQPRPTLDTSREPSLRRLASVVAVVAVLSSRPAGVGARTAAEAFASEVQPTSPAARGVASTAVPVRNLRRP